MCTRKPGGPFGPPFLSYADIIAAHGRDRPNDAAFVQGDQRLTWRDFDRATNRVANALLRDGLRKGDAVAVLTPNVTWAYVVAFGIMKAGGVFTPLSPLLTPALVARLIADAGARKLFVSQALLDLALAAEREGATVAMVIDGHAPPTRRSFAVFQADAPCGAPEVALDREDRCNIIYSSGTTGTPKGIVHGHGARVGAAYELGLALRFSAGCRTLVATPPHSNGTWMTVLPTVLVGGTTVLMPKFDPDQMFLHIALHRPTHAFIVPAMWQALLPHAGMEGADFSSFGCIVTAGAPMPDAMKAEVRRRTGERLFELWGFTESVATVISPEEMAARPRSVGRPMPGCEIRVIDDDHRDITGHGTGEIVGRSISVMEGYLNRPDANAAIRWTDARGNAYLRTGDIGEVDADGYLTLRGRAKDMIISGGLNVFPIDLEAVLLQHESVADASVVGVPDERWGETPVAFVIPRPGAAVNSRAVTAWANERLARFQRIADLMVLREFPRNALGKVLKNELRDLYLATDSAGG